MKSANRTGLLLGILLLLQLAGLTVPFILLHPLQSPPGFLENAAGVAFQIKVAVILFFVNCALTIGIAAITFQIFRHYSYALALGLLSASIIMFVMQAVDNVHLLSMVSLSQEYVGAGGANAELFHGLATVVSTTRKWTHYTELLSIDAWMFLFYGLMWRSALVPRALTAFTLLTITLHTVGISLPQFLGYRGVTLLGVPLAASYVAMAAWLMIKGFDERHRPLASGEAA
ncbi:MAG TPA: DUF4386 domain-containing protein [Pyrinomonadaceae bacterium]|nr:DUF4386 domain-containing protein [Pyrinomonadaceae bacterium]